MLGTSRHKYRTTRYIIYMCIYMKNYVLYNEDKIVFLGEKGRGGGGFLKIRTNILPILLTNIIYIYIYINATGIVR